MVYFKSLPIKPLSKNEMLNLMILALFNLNYNYDTNQLNLK